MVKDLWYIIQHKVTHLYKPYGNSIATYIYTIYLQPYVNIFF